MAFRMLVRQITTSFWPPSIRFSASKLSGLGAFLFFNRLMAFSTSTVNGMSRIYSSFSVETGISTQYLLLAQAGLDFQWLQIGLDLKSGLPMYSGDMVDWL